MRVALVILHADPSRGGAERYTNDLADALVTRGHAVTLLAGDGTHAALVRLNTGGSTRVGRYRRFQRSLSEHLRHNVYDVVHAMLPVPGCDVYHPHAGVAAEAINSGSRLSRLGNRFNRRRHAMAAVEHRLLSGANPPLVLCLSDYSKQNFRRFYPEFAESHLVKLFNGVDLYKFDPVARPGAGDELRRRFQLQSDDVVALMIAQDFERKGLRQVLGALARVPEGTLKLLVVGKQNPAPYRAAAELLEVSERVVFAGPTTDPYAFYQSADLFVLPTRHDPCSLVVLEALAMGLPVITTVNNGAAEAMMRGQHGFVLSSPDDGDGLTAAIGSLLEPRLRRSMREACLALRPALSMDSHLDTLEAAYRLSVG